MREIAAASDFDFVTHDRPARKPKSPKAQSSTAQAGRRPSGKSASRSAAAKIVSPFVLAWRYRTPLLGCLFFVGILVMIPVNALMMQHGRHPAPLLGTIFKPTAPKAATPPAPVRGLAKAEDADLTAAPAAQATLSDESPAPAPSFAPLPVRRPGAAPATLASAKAAGHDAIGSLIDGGVPPAATAAPATKSILSVQHALQKLGATVKADGEMGAGTRQAIANFEREHGMPVDGELTPRLRRALAARSGMPVE